MHDDIALISRMGYAPRCPTQQPWYLQCSVDPRGRNPTDWLRLHSADSHLCKKALEAVQPALDCATTSPLDYMQVDRTLEGLGDRVLEGEEA